MDYDELLTFVESLIPGPGQPGSRGPSKPATVTYEITGPDAEELRAVADRNN
jgi:hypothetical protein